jgi:FAD:protein FMN transferase
MTTIYARRPAMRTLFEIVLGGEDASRLRSLAEDALDEVERVERLLSRFDPSAELYRLNQSRGERMRVDPELFDVLQAIVEFRRLTEGWFEPFLVAGRRGGPEAPLLFDADRCTVQFAKADLSIDLGGFAKGYALDLVRQMLDRAGSENWLLSGGGSSVAGSGCREEGRPWIVRLEDPFAGSDASTRHVVEFPLEDLSLSTSSVLGAGASAETASDLVDPKQGLPLAEAASCSVLHESAAAAEAWSTALLAAGRARAVALLDRAQESENVLGRTSLPSRVYWIDQRDGAPQVELLSGEGHALADRSA